MSATGTYSGSSDTALPHNRMKLKMPWEPLYSDLLIAFSSRTLYLYLCALSHLRYSYKLFVLDTTLLNYR
jgi:hypothetical protein